MTVRRQKKPVSQRRWRTAPPGLAEVAKEKADARGKPNSSPVPIKRPTIADIMVTKKGIR